MRYLLLLCLSCSNETRVVTPTSPRPRAEVWTDPVTSQLWMTSASQVVWSAAEAACVTPWRTPTPGDYERAYTRGLHGGVSWSIVVSSTQALTYDLDTGKMAVVDKDTKAGTACVREKQG